ncbi:cardiac-enriched FHL2-interacting protein [Brachionichthys hirsutus]|uniref:cardiac-enriched FHL2-interacting protein n=1 Tax=Brachionichthys hirsutus TaxID=412623 RepID=UPI0036047A45
MSCVEKRHMSHRTGSMLHHRFPNSFTDLFMDETDREVSTLTDRAFRSLCVGDEAVYSDDFLYGYSPFSCHKPLVGEPPKKTRHKESKRQGQNKNNKECSHSWKQQQQKSIAHMSSFLKALSATEESCEGILIKNGGLTDSKGESWDQSALRSIQKELSEFSSNYHKEAALPTGKSSKTKNGKSTVKLKKLNITNFFLHSEFSPFQTWGDIKQFPFSDEDAALCTENIPNWCDMPFYKELTEAHRKETLRTEEAPSVKPPPPTAPSPVPPSAPPKVLTNPSFTPVTKSCPSDGRDGTCAPWRRNKSREKSVIPFNQPGMPPKAKDSKIVGESHLPVRKEFGPTEVRAVEDANSLASTPFSICQLMTPLIPSRQPTETSEILQGILSPSSLDLPLRPHSVVKLTPEPPVKRDSYKSLASSILFNLKDNRKRVKSHYSPPKFQNAEVRGCDAQSPLSEDQKQPKACSQGNSSDLTTAAVLKDEQTACSPRFESDSTPVGLNKGDTDKCLSGDYLLSNLLQNKREAGNSSLGEENPISPLICSRKNTSSEAQRQNYPSLNLYMKASAADSGGALLPRDKQADANQFSPLLLDKELSPKSLATITALSPNNVYVNTDQSSIISPHALENEDLSSEGKRPPNILEKLKQPAREVQEKHFGARNFSSKEKDTSGQSVSTADVIRAAKEAINAAKSKALCAVQSGGVHEFIPETEELRERETDETVVQSKEALHHKREDSVLEDGTSQSGNETNGATTKKAPPPVPKKNFLKSDIQFHLDKQPVDQLINGEMDATLDLPRNEKEWVQFKHAFSARQNDYIKSQRYSVTDDGRREELEECDPKVNTRMEKAEETISLREIRDSERINNDFNALKELERTRPDDPVLDHTKNRSGAIVIDEETKAKNDLISRELRSIKKSMLNTSAKRELHASKEIEHHKQDRFTKIDGNVIVNKALFNGNYDKAKMALEEIILDRQKRKSKLTEQDANPIFTEKTSNESYESGVQPQGKSMNDSMTGDKEKQNALAITQEADLKARLSDLRDRNQIRRILSQTEPGLEDSPVSCGRIPLPVNKSGNEPNGIVKSHATHANDKSEYESQENRRRVVRQISEESGESLTNPSEGRRRAAPPVPPRSKRGAKRRDASAIDETDRLKDGMTKDIFDNDGKLENDEACSKEMKNTDSHPLPRQNQTIADEERWDMEEDGFSGVSPSSEGAESITSSPADAANEVRVNAGVPAKPEVPKLPSEHLVSTCSGNESQTGLPKPPAVLPKSEKAVLRAIKIANRRLKKEEAQKSSRTSSQSSTKHRTERQKSDTSDHKSSKSSRNSKSNERKTDREGHHHSEGHGTNGNDLLGERSERPQQDRNHTAHNNTRQSHDPVEDNTRSNAAPSGVAGRQGRSSTRHVRDKPDQRNYSSDRLISKVPVYKAHISGGPTLDRQHQRSQSIDRHLGDKVVRRLSADMPIDEKLEPRSRRIEKSTVDGLQQRGRARDKASRDNSLRRSHSIDTYSTEASRPSTVSRQSSVSSHTSHSSQLSRQSSVEHAIVTQSFPMTQRKLLQDPDSGQYFLVDMPMQVKTKTFFDPETGTYVQLPVQPAEGSVPQASPLEVLNPPLVVYRGFVPVPLSPMALKASMPAPRVAAEETEQRHRATSMQMHNQERHPYLEPVYTQHDHIGGEVLGTEELDCVN